jgi:hypothetical protein
MIRIGDDPEKWTTSIRRRRLDEPRSDGDEQKAADGGNTV